MKPFRILHLSDIHIGDTYTDSQSIAYRIIDDIEKENLCNIQSVVITGDIFEGRVNNSPDLVEEAVRFFDIIYSELRKSTKIKKTDFLFVPGNHDIVRTADLSQRWTKYRAFLESFYGTIPSFYCEEDFSLMKVYQEDKILFLGFNSVAIKKEPLFDSNIQKKIARVDDSLFAKYAFGKKDLQEFFTEQTKNADYADYGEIPPQQLLTQRRKLKEYDDFNTIAFFHHHFYLFPEVYSRYGDTSLIRNYTNIIQQLQQSGIKTVLHGHKHFDLERPLITDSYYHNPNNVINIIAGGSVGTNRVQRHTFNIIDFFDKQSDLQIIQRKFVYNNDQLEPIITRHIPPQIKSTNTAIELLNTLQANDPELYSNYMTAIDKINIAANDYQNMFKWLENLFVGFDNVHKLFDRDSLCLFFLLFAMNYRILKQKELLGKERIPMSHYSALNTLYDTVITDAGFDKESYLMLFDQCDLIHLKKQSDQIFNSLQTQKAKQYFSFSMISIFITDVYLMLRYYAGSFYNQNIQYKVNIRLDETEFHQNVPVQKIMIHSDSDRRSAFIDLRCNSATSHKIAVLFIKEFELIISEFEDYFKTVGLKLYYFTPKIENSNKPTAIDNYNFEAYIPTLIPLLTGDNIYAKKEVFARELIQNSIDAIAVRAVSEPNIDQKIYITFGEKDERKYFKIKDHGTGMDRFKIERYFTSIGRSFYSGNEYRDMDIDYSPISNFGIGFLSAFMVCREIDVRTKYYAGDQEGLKLHIPNFDGCFFIERDDDAEIGTEITLYIDPVISHNIKLSDIREYISSTMLDICNDIVIYDETKHSTNQIFSRQVRRRSPIDGTLFIPFTEKGAVVRNIEIENSLINSEYINRYPYGMLIDITGNNKLGYVLNSGIKASETEISEIWDLLFRKDHERFYLKEEPFLINFPPSFLNIDVSREKVSDFSKQVPLSTFRIDLFSEICSQLKQFIDFSKKKNISYKAKCLQEILLMLLSICKPHKDLSSVVSELDEMSISLYIQVTENSVDLGIGSQCSKPFESSYQFAIPRYRNSVQNKLYKLLESLFRDDKRCCGVLEDKDNVTYLRVKMHRILEPYGHFLQMMPKRMDKIFSGCLMSSYFEDHFLNFSPDECRQTIMKKLKTRDNQNSMVYAFLILFAYVEHGDNLKFFTYMMYFILDLMLEEFSISQIMNKKGIISLQAEDFKAIIDFLFESA